MGSRAVQVAEEGPAALRDYVRSLREGDRRGVRRERRAVVVGAGVFGASTARELARRGWDVTLVEQYTPGNVRSGSGGDTRLLRFSHGDAEWYTLLARGARSSSGGSSRPRRGVRLFEPVGVAWFDSGGGDFTQRSEVTLSRLGIPCERLTPEEARRLYPSLGGDDLRSVLFEPDAGVLYARLATRALAAASASRSAAPTPADPPERRRRRLGLRRLAAEALPRPRRAADLSTRRLLHRRRRRLGRHARLLRLRRALLRSRRARRARDEGLARPPGGEVDPDPLERMPDPAMEALAREYTARRFPSLAGAPIVGASVCQYDLTPDSHFLVARHPEQPELVARGRWLRPRLQARAGAGRVHRRLRRGPARPEPFHGLGPREGHAGLRTAEVERY